MNTFNGTTTRQKLIYLSLIMIFACQNPIANEVPYLFYRSDLECLVGDEWIACKESELCENNYEYKFVNTNGINSVSMTFGLICEKKLLEATIIFLGPLAQMLAFFFTIFYEIPRSKKFSIIYKSLLFQSLSLMSLIFLSQSLFFIVVIWFIWNFVWAFYFGQIMYYVEDNFPQKLSLKTPVFMNLVWPTGGLIFVAITFINGNWIDHCVYMIGMPILLTTLAFYYLSPKSANSPQQEEGQLQSAAAADALIDSKPLKQQLIKKVISSQEQLLLKEGQKSKAQKNQEELESELKQKSFIQDLVEKFKELMRDRVCLKNMLIYLISWVIQMLGINATFIAFNSVGGNMQMNVFSSIVFELCGSVIAMYLMEKYNCFKILEYNFIIVGIVQTSVFFNNSGFMQICVINITKVCNKITFAAILLALNYLLPTKFIQLTFSLTNIVSIASNSTLPFYKYYMDLLDINFFFGLGIGSFLTVLLIKQSTILNNLDQQTQDPELNQNEKIDSRKNSQPRISNHLIQIDKNVIQS